MWIGIFRRGNSGGAKREPTGGAAPNAGQAEYEEDREGLRTWHVADKDGR